MEFPPGDLPGTVLTGNPWNSHPGAPHHPEQGAVVAEAPEHSHEGHQEHGDSQQEQQHGRSQENPFQGSVPLPLHLGVNPNTQDQQPQDLHRDWRDF